MAIVNHITHRDIIASMPPEVLAHLKRLSDGPGLAHLGGHLALLAATGTAVMLAPNPLVLFLAMLAHGIVLVFLFTLEHECIHGTAFRSQWLDTVCADVAGFLFILPPRYFRYFHFAHHRHTQDGENDPELASPRPHDAWSYAWYLSGIPYWRSAFQAVFNNAIGRTLPNFVVGTGRRVVTEARIHIALWILLAMASIAFGWTWPLKLWIVPALLGQPVLRAFLLAEHAACPAVSNMLENSRTTITTRLVRFLCWNMSFHAAHHTIPTVPFHRTQELTYLIARQLEITSLGYIAAHREIRAAWTDHDADTEAAL
jgi:fatty acid desaturase